ncbi:thrombospondin type 3 repeat-containing protein [Verrucomicrobium spinosum]|uniref:thrombospondin type 3 repeat-containing protein n=1 Tax=Verrucomicrobium spinosum TaxID=2736 RepID=UPI0004922C4B|nr:thrombospondin type 3 repeat-containing protein [Verrucomicrobium spinosum]
MKRFCLFAVWIFLGAFAALSQTADDLNSGLKLDRDPESGTYTLSWWGAAGRSYYILQSEDLRTWNYFPVEEHGNDSVITWGFANTSERSFFKLKHVENPGGTTPLDSDGDGLSNWDEVQEGTDPFNQDTDGDGSYDDEEKNSNTDAKDPESKPELLDPAGYVEVQARSINAYYQDAGGQIEHTYWMYYSPFDEPSYMGSWQPYSGWTEYVTPLKQGSASYSDFRETPVYESLEATQATLGDLANVENGWYSAYGLLSVNSSFSSISQGSGGGSPPAGAYSNGATWETSYQMDSALNWSGGAMEVRLKWRPNKPRAERLSPVTMAFLKVTRENGEVQKAAAQTLTIAPNYSTSGAGGEQNNGTIGLKADTTANGNSVSEDLMPIEVRDGDRTLTSLPLDEDSWTTANLQKQIPDSTIALIKPHDGFGDRPEMPRIEISIPQAPTSLEVSWKIEIEYKRGNGYRASYVQDFSRPEDKVRLPELEAGADGMLAPRPANEVWKVWESSDWERQLDENGFFGGIAKVYAIFSSDPAHPPKEVFRFRIGGKNPEESKARQYIDWKAGATFWYAYAIAKHETFGRVRGRFYNHFYTDYQGIGGRIGDNAGDMGWAAWAKSWPLYNLDRGYNRATGYNQNGPGGYGIFQVTLGPKTPDGNQTSEGFIDRNEIWNWQENCNRAIGELQGKLPAAQRLENGLTNTYNQNGPLPAKGRLSGLEAITATYYNGTAGLPSRIVNGSNRRTPWTPEARVQGGQTTRFWQFHENVNDYCQHINQHIE